MNKTRIVFMGTPEFSCSILQQLIDDDYDVIAVVSQPDKPVGRKRILQITPTKALAQSLGILVMQPTRIREEYQDIIDLNPDLIITCAYGQILPKILLDSPSLGAINIHASLLPKHRGGAPIHHAIIQGDKETGISVMRMAPKMDAGAVCYQNRVIITDEDTTGTLYKKLQVAGAKAISTILPKIIDQSAVFEEQNDEEATFSYNISKEDEYIDFNRTTKTVYNHIRGLIPQPSGYCYINGKKLKFHAVRIGKLTSHTSGQIIDYYNGGMEISTLDGSISVLSCQMEGKGIVDAKSFWSGYQHLKGDIVNEN